MLVKNDCDRRNGRMAELTTGEPPVRKRRPPETRGPRALCHCGCTGYSSYGTMCVYLNSLKLCLRQMINATLRFANCIASDPIPAERSHANLPLWPTNMSLHFIHARSLCGLSLRLILRKLASPVTRSSVSPYCHGILRELAQGTRSSGVTYSGPQFGPCQPTCT